MNWLNPATEPGDVAQHHQFRPARPGLAVHQVDRARRRSTSTCAASCAGRSRRARLRLRRRRAGCASSRASGCTLRRSAVELGVGGAQEVDLLGQLGARRTSPPVPCRAVSADRRRVSVSTILRKSAIRWRGGALAPPRWRSSVVRALAVPLLPSSPSRIFASRVSGATSRSAWYAENDGPLRGLVLPEFLDDLRRSSSSVELERLRRSVGEQFGDQLAQRVEVDRARRRCAADVVVDGAVRALPTPAGTTGRTARRRSRGGSAGAAARRPGPRAAASRSSRSSTAITRPASTVSDGPDRDAPRLRSASTKPTRWPGSPCGAQDAGRSGAAATGAIGQPQFSRSSARPAAGRTGA